MEYRLLGALEARRNGVALTLGGARQRTVLAALALRANEPVTVDWLVDAVWEKPPASAGSNLRTYVARLRRLLACPDGAEPLTAHPAGYVLAAGPGECDVAVFGDLAGRGADAAGRGDLAEAARYFEQALALWSGQPLAELPLGPALQTELDRLAERRLSVADQCARVRAALGDHGGAVAVLRDLVTWHPLREDLWVRLMLALARAGRPAEALDAYQEVRRALVDELGLEPGGELRRVQAALLAGEDPAPGGGAEPPVTVRADRQLPMDIEEFTGRVAELRALHALAAADTGVTVVTIQGMAGVGKTRLAVRAAHEIVRTGRFDEVQLYADLDGFAAGAPKQPPAGALERFLRLLGVPGDQIPAGLDDRATLYRDRLHGRRALVVLDNAADEEQVRPLLPGSGPALVLVTSRNTLAGLDGAHHLALGEFGAAEAMALLGRIAGPDRVRAQPRAANRIVELCGRLPLAVALAARRLQARPAWTPSDLAARLEAADLRLSRLSADTRAVRTAFDLSYRALPPDQRRMFRLLALHPGDDATAGSVAALAAVAPAEAETVLEALLDNYLLQQTEPDRYRLHDLIRLYAGERAEAEETAAERDAARERVLGWYLHAAHAADAALDPQRWRTAPDATPVPDHLPVLGSHDEALRWLERERPILVAAVHAAAAAGLDAISWQLARTLLAFFYLRSHWDDWLGVDRTALAAARRLGDRHAEAGILDALGVAHSDLGWLTESVVYHRQALVLHREVGDRRGEGWSLNNLGVTHSDESRYAEALDCFEQAVVLFRAVGDRRGEGIALSNLADTCRILDRPEDTARWLPEALALQQQTGDEYGLRFTLYRLGDFHQDLGRHAEAARYYRQGLAIARALGDRWGIASVLTRLGHTLADLGDAAGAGECWEEALAILDELHDPRAAEVRTQLSRL
jgi:DNA-binding SARP family transcriptional activator